MGASTHVLRQFVCLPSLAVALAHLRIQKEKDKKQLLIRRMSNRPLATIEIPNGTAISDYEADLIVKYPQIEFQFSNSEHAQPTVVSCDRRDADLGSIDGDKDKPFVAIITGIQSHLFQRHREKQNPRSS
jgi:hypothetical protein